MLDELRNLFLRELKCDDGMTATILVGKWNKAVRRVQDVFDNMTDKASMSQPERKKGKWIIVTDSRGQHAECPYCGEWKYHSNQKFCGECGVELEVEE